MVESRGPGFDFIALVPVLTGAKALLLVEDPNLFLLAALGLSSSMESLSLSFSQMVDISSSNGTIPSI
jgi:hypothetical protein